MYRNHFANAVAIGILILGGLTGMSSFTTPTASAAQTNFHGGATDEMLAFALNFNRASGVQSFGQNGVQYAVRDTLRARAVDPQIAVDIENAFRAIGQLPCENVDSSALGGRTFGPGVYCLASADLARSMTLDGGGDTNARFVFRIAGSMTTAADASIELINGAISSNAYFVAGDRLSIGERGRINGNLISSGDVNIDGGSTVSGRAISVKGSVNITDSVVAAGTGYIEVCKNIVANDPIPAGTLFTFNVAGTNYQAPAGGCTSPIQVASGNITVTEATRANTAVVGIAATPSNRLVSSNFGTQTAVVAVPDGDVNNQTVVTFTNQTTRTGVLEICKYNSGLPAAPTTDTDVTGFFQFNVQGVIGQTFAVPVGFCTGPITTTIPLIPGSTFTANVTELAQATYRLEAVDTLPIGQLTGPFTPDQGFDNQGNPITNTNGGYANVALTTGGAPLMTVVNFRNRSLPGRIKVCKITADEVNIPIGTLFTFTVAGLHPTSATQTAPGIAATETMTVAAGPASQNGFCAFAPGTWIVGTPVTVTETGVAPLPNGFTFADVRVSRIRALPSLISSSLDNKTATLTARNATAEVEFTNYIFRPAILKICKIGATSTVTGNFSFTMSLVNPLTSLPVSSTPITIPVNSCTFAQGPYAPIAAFPGIGTFNLGTQLIVTEAASGTTIVTAVTSPTSPVIADLPGRRGTITLTQAAVGTFFNEIAFTNAIGGGGSTAAGVSISGRVLTDNEYGLRNAYVTLTGMDGTSRRSLTSAFGYYRFDDVTPGASYIIDVQSKRYSFMPRSISVSDNLVGLDMVAMPQP